MEKIKLYYWPIMMRGASALRMLEHTNAPFEWISDKAEMAKICSAFGAQGDTFAPPVVVDGKTVLSQQVAVTFYLGKRLGLVPKNFSEAKALQYMLDVIDTFENGWGKNNEHGPTLKKWVEGDRCRSFMSNIERSIQGPYYFGEEPSCADFLLLAHLDWRWESLFEPLRVRFGVDVMAQYPKMTALRAALTATEQYKRSGHKLPGPIKDEVLNEYNAKN